MKKIYKILLFFFLLIFYVVIINLISNLNFAFGSYYIENWSFSSLDIKVGVSENVNIAVTRNRWYGTIIEGVGDKQKSILQLFNIIPLPIKVNNKNWGWLHIIYFLIITYIFLIVMIVNYLKKDSSTNLKTKSL